MRDRIILIIMLFIFLLIVFWIIKATKTDFNFETISYYFPKDEKLYEQTYPEKYKEYKYMTKLLNEVWEPPLIVKSEAIELNVVYRFKKHCNARHCQDYNTHDGSFLSFDYDSHTSKKRIYRSAKQALALITTNNVPQRSYQYSIALKYDGERKEKDISIIKIREYKKYKEKKKLGGEWKYL